MENKQIKKVINIRSRAVKNLIRLFVLFLLVSLILLGITVLIALRYPDFFSNPVRRGIIAGVSIILLGSYFLLHIYKQFLKYEEEIKEEQETITFLNSLFDAVPYPLIFLNLENKFKKANAAAFAFFGEKFLKEGKAEDIANLIIEADREKFLNLISEPTSIRSSLVRLTISEKIHNFEFSIFPVVEEGKQIGSTLLMVDRTAEMEARAREQEMRERLLIMQKHEALSRLSGSIAHDINNILAIILTNAELILQNCDEEKIKNSANTIVEASKRAARIVLSLLSYAKGQPSREEIVDLCKVLSDFSDFIRASLPKRIELELNIPDKPISVKSSAVLIEQILMNMISNAVDAIEEKGKISIELKEVFVDEEKSKFYGYVSPGRFACICVKDTGCGIKEKDIDKIFEPYYSTKKQGSGLGLATVYGIVKKLGGFIEVKSEPSKGTEFKIFIPIFKFS